MFFNKVIYTAIAGALLVGGLTTSCNNDDEVVELYKGTLTVLQKDAYSEAAGRSSDLWPPHTTTVLQWAGEDGGDSDSTVQLNHGTAPGATNPQGEVYLVETKVYSFSGTRSDMDALQSAYEIAICDNGESKFLDLTEGEGVLEKVFLTELRDIIFSDDEFTCSGSVNKDSIIAFLEAGDVHKVIAEIHKCSWTSSDWLIAFEAALGKAIEDLGHAVDEYHVCNNDAIMQVEMVKAFIATGEVPVPSGDCNGPIWLYVPE